MRKSLFAFSLLVALIAGIVSPAMPSAQAQTVGDLIRGVAESFLGSSSSTTVSGNQVLGYGTLTIQSAGFGEAINNGRATTFRKTRDLTAEEKSQISFKILDSGSLLNHTVETDVRIGQSVTLPVYNATRGPEYPESGWYWVVAQSVPDGYNSFNVDCSGTVFKDRNSVCSIGFFSGAVVKDVRNPFSSASAGPSATLASFVPGAITAQLGGTVLNLAQGSSENTQTSSYASRSTASIRFMNQYAFNGKDYLLVGVSDRSTTSIYVYDISDPNNPVLLKKNEGIIPGMQNTLLSADGYRYFIVPGSIADFTTDDRTFSRIYQFDPSGSITLVRTMTNAEPTPIKIFSEGNKFYVGAYATGNYEFTYPNGDPNASGPVYDQNQDAYGNPRPLARYTNAILFFDVTEGMSSLTQDKVLSGHRSPRYTTTDLGELIRQPLLGSWGFNPFVVTVGGKTYFGTFWNRDVHRLHSSTYHLMVLDVSSVQNVSVVQEISSNSRVSAMFNHSKDLTDIEKSYLNFESDGGMFVDERSGSAVHYFSNYVASLGLFAPVFDAQSEGSNLSKLRIWDVILGARATGSGSFFSEIPGTRAIVCEQRGGNETRDRYCGSDSKNTRTINFGDPVGYTNGLVISSTGMAGLIGTGGFIPVDTQSVFLGNGSNSLSGAQIVQVDGNHFVVYANTGTSLERVNLTTSQTITPSVGGNPVTPGTSLPSDGRSTPTFSLRSIVNSFLRVLGL